MRSVVVAVAITGSVPRKSDNPSLPVTPAEQVEATHEAFEAGATLVHVHARNDDESPSSDVARFAQVLEGVRRHCPGMVVQFSTGGRGRSQETRGAPISLRPDMASLSTGSVNFPSIVYQNEPSLVDELARAMQRNDVRPEIEIFDLSHLHGAKRLADMGLIDERPHIQFVLGVKNAMPAERRLLDILVDEMSVLFPEATWTAAGIGRYQASVIDWALARGAPAVRTGLEDNIRVSRDRLARSNAELVTIACEAIERRGCIVASPAEARSLLRLDMPANPHQASYGEALAHAEQPSC